MNLPQGMVLRKWQIFAAKLQRRSKANIKSRKRVIEHSYWRAPRIITQINRGHIHERSHRIIQGHHRLKNPIRSVDTQVPRLGQRQPRTSTQLLLPQKGKITAQAISTAYPKTAPVNPCATNAAVARTTTTEKCLSDDAECLHQAETN